jgi:hypothetical protein
MTAPVVFDAQTLHEFNVLRPPVVHVRCNIAGGFISDLACADQPAAAATAAMAAAAEQQQQEEEEEEEEYP